MRLKITPFTCFIVAFLLLFSIQAFSDEITTNYTSKVIESFDNPDAQQWIVTGSKFSTEGYPKKAYANAWPEAIFGKNKEGKELKALGIHGKFDRKAYNYIEIIPAAKNDKGELVPKAIDLPVRVKTIDLWAWGSNYDYSLEVHIRDYEGIEHTLQLGSLRYEDWKDLYTSVPSSIPQSRRYLPKRRNLQLTKLVLWTRPEEKVDGFYVYFDQLKVLTDLFESRFDGDNLIEPDVLNKIWKSESAK